MDMSGDFTFDTPKHYTTKIESKGSRSMGGRTTIERTATARVQAHGEFEKLTHQAEGSVADLTPRCDDRR